MSESQIANALFDRLANLTLSPALQVAWPNKVFGPDKPDTYLRASLLRAETQPIGIAAWNEHVGILQVDVVYKKQDGEVKPLAIADSVAAWFGRGTRLTSGSVQVDVYEKPSIGSAIDNRDGYFFYPVSVRYRSFLR
jgi:hypothetical protein